MPLYGFRCPKCEMEFEVSRKMSDASNPANCPLDGAASDRIFTAPVKIGQRGGEAPPPPAKPQAPAGGGFAHFGHSHGYGASSHAHGAPPRPAPPAS